MGNWKKIKEYLLNKDCKNVHKFIWEDHAIITDKGGKRYRIDGSNKISDVRAFINMLISKNESSSFKHKERG